MNDKILLREDRGPVAVLTLNRPEARNSLSEELIGALTAAVSEICRSDALRAIVVTGAGTAFSSGHDLKELTAHRNDPDRGRAFFAKTLTACSDMMLAIVRSPKPVIAAVNGIATAAGCQLVASCDLAVASRGRALRHAWRQYRPVLLDADGRALRNVSRKAAMEMLLPARWSAPMTQSRSVSSIAWFRPTGWSTRRSSLAREIALKSKRTLEIGKEAFYRQLDMSLDDAYAYASEVMVENMLDAEAEEGIGAFIDKRQPNWPR